MVTIEASTLFLKIEGELTIYKVEELLKQLFTSFGAANTIFVDMSDTTKVDTAGFQLLASLKKSCAAMNKSFEIVGLGESAQNFMSLFGSNLASDTRTL